MARPVSKKMGIKEGMRTFLVNVPKDALETIDLVDQEIAATLAGNFDYIHFFTKSQAEFEERFPRLKAHLKPTGMLWVSWPNGVRYPRVGGTRESRFAGTHLSPRKLLENAATPTRRVHAVLGRQVLPK